MKEPIPEQRTDTIRQEILAALANRRISIRELSRAVGKPEKELYSHLENLSQYKSVVMYPAQCSQCGFVFEDRARAKMPGKCPKCKSTRIEAALFGYTPD